MQKLLLSKLLLMAVTIAVATVPAIGNAQTAVRGMATWYGPGFIGNRTANGELFNPSALTSVVVRINDRLGDPAIAIDLSMGAAKAIQLTETSPVKLEILSSN
jgi:rare lipoprotein A